jgi:chemotaxis protein methyltransferase CheR
MFENIDITNEEFAFIKELIYRNSGITLTDQKKIFVVSRLQKSIKALGFNTFSEYLLYLRYNPSEISTLINLISTNHTFFYREERHFDYFLKTALPNVVAQLKEKGDNDLRIWCAGCSTGEEAYLLEILLQEFFGKEYFIWNAGILATDISGRVLDVSKAGIYHENRFEKMPPELKNKYFFKIKEDHWKVANKIKNEVTFRRFNLMNENFPFKKPFHIIFCRNVMIYFDLETRIKLTKKFHRFIVPNGYLFIGHSETIGREQNLFKFIKPAVYRRI